MNTKEENKECSILTQQSCIAVQQTASISKKVIEMSSKDQVAINLQNLHSKFTSIIAKVRSHLADAIEDETHKLVDIALFVEEYTEGKGLTKLENIHELFNTIQPHYCFLNCELIEELVKQFLSGDVLQTELKEYLTELEIFSESSQLQYIKTAIEEALLPKQEVTEISCEVIIKLHGRCGQMTLKNFYKLINYLFPTKKHFLTHIHIEPGSICVRLLAPQSQSQSLILMATEKRDFMYQVGIFEMFINDQPILMEEEGTAFSFEQSLLQAAQAGHNNDVIILLELGANVDYQNEIGRTAPMLATNGEHEKVVQTLILAGANVDIQDYCGNTALMIALNCVSNNSHYQIIDLLKENVDLNLQNQEGWTALMFASKNGHYQVVELLIKEKADPNIQAQNGVTALMIACEIGRYHVVDLLLKENADHSLQDQEGWTPLMFASDNGHYQAVELLLNKNADPNLQDQEGWTSLMFASDNGHFQVVELLLQKNADPDLQDEEGWTALIFASQNGHYQAVELLLQKNVDPNIQTKEGSTALAYASQNGHYQVVEILLKENANPNLQDLNGWTALIFASQNGHYQVVELLLKENSDPNLQDQDGWTALIFASQNGHYQIVELLLKENADPNLQTPRGSTALIFASGNGHYQVVDLLLKENGDPNLQDQEGWNALIFASGNGHYQVVELLLKENADPNVQDQEGWTAVMFASQNGHYQVVERLLKENADPNFQTGKGWTALTIASQNGHFEVAHLLEKYIDPSSSSCKVLDHSINQPVESTSSAILIPDQQTEEPNKQLQSVHTTTEYVVEQDVLPHSTIHSSSLKQSFQYRLIKSIKQPFHTFKDTKKKELRDNKSTILEQELPPQQHRSTLIQLPLPILRKKLKKTQRKDNVTSNNIVKK